jgi:CitB domain protein
MATDTTLPAAATEDRHETSLHALVREAERQLIICNACRYCEGLCAVFPALERRTVLGTGDVLQLANLCHDCRACYDACMYAPPHEFAINPPAILSAARLQSYQRYLWPRRVPRLFRGRIGVFTGMVLATIFCIAIAWVTSGPEALFRGPANGAYSPYEVIPYEPFFLMGLLPAVFAAVITYLAGRAYWREIGGRPAGAGRVVPLLKAIWHSMALTNQRGGGADCHYPRDDKPSPARRRLHITLVAGYGLCVVSTLSAAFLQDILHIDPPYPVLSVPVLSGTLGGIGITIGCIGLVMLKKDSSEATSVAEMNIKDYGLLSALFFLATTGLFTLMVRATAAYPLVLVIHMASVMLFTAMAPYSKLIHAVFRFQALVRDEMEAAAEQARRR